MHSCCINIPDAARSFDHPDFILRAGTAGGGPAGQQRIAPAALLPPPWSAPLRHDDADEGADRIRQTRLLRAHALPLVPQLHGRNHHDLRCAGRLTGPSAGSARAGSLARRAPHRCLPGANPRPRRPWTSRKFSRLNIYFIFFRQAFCAPRPRFARPRAPQPVSSEQPGLPPQITSAMNPLTR